MPLLPAQSGGVPQLMNYQGRVTVAGTNFNGTGYFKFSLVDGASQEDVPAYSGSWRRHHIQIAAFSASPVCIPCVVSRAALWWPAEWGKALSPIPGESRAVV